MHHWRTLGVLVLIGLLGVGFIAKTGTLQGSMDAEDVAALPTVLTIAAVSAACMLVAAWRGWSLLIAALLILIVETALTLYVLG